MVREVADELYIKRVSMALEDFLFFSLYSFSCIANSSTTLKDILILVFSIRTSSSVPQHPYHLRPTPPVTGCGFAGSRESEFAMSWQVAMDLVLLGAS